MSIDQLLGVYIPPVCFLLAAVGTILLAPKPLLKRHICGIELVITGVMAYSAWVGWSVSHSWYNLTGALIVTIITDVFAYLYLTNRKD